MVLLRMSNYQVNRISILTCFFGFLVLTIVPDFILQDQSFFFEKPQVIELTYIIMSLTLPFMVVGSLVANFYIYNLKFGHSIIYVRFNENILLGFAIIISIVTLLRFNLVLFLDPVKHLLQGDVATAMLSRSKLINSSDGGTGINSLIFNYLAPIYSVAIFSIRKKVTYPLIYCAVSLFLIFIFFMYQIGTMQKYYVGNFLIFCVLFFQLCKSSTFDIPRLILSSFTVMLGISFMWIFMSGSELSQIFNAFGWIVKRVASEHFLGLSYYVDYGLNNSLWLGKSFPNPLGFMPYEAISLTKTISQNYILSSSQLKLGLTGSHPTFFSGEVFVNFGLLGIPFVAFIVGLIAGAIDVFFKRNRDKFGNVEWALLYTIFIVFFLQLASNSIFVMFHYLFVFSENVGIIIFSLMLCMKWRVSRNAYGT